MKIAIMDASTGTLTLVILPSGIDAETYVYKTLGHKETNVDWMEIDTIDGLDDFINCNEINI